MARRQRFRFTRIRIRLLRGDTASHRASRLTPMRIALIVGALLAIARCVDFKPLRILDARSVDLRLLARGPEPASPDVVIVAVDDQSIAQVGRWPWSRGTLAELLDRIDAAGPLAIGFDIVQSEATTPPDLSSLKNRVDADALAKVTNALSEGNPEDRRLAESVAKSGRVVLGYFFEIPGVEPQEPPEEPDAPFTEYTIVQQKDHEGARHVPPASAVTTNIPPVAAGAKKTGYFNMIPDPNDGYWRRVPMVLRYGNRLAVPLSLATLSVAYPDRTLLLKIADRDVVELRFGSEAIPVREDGQLLVNYRGPQKTFVHIVASDLLAGRVNPDALRGKIVLVGVTATAVADVRATAFDPSYPGVEIHASAIDNILRRDFLEQPWWMLLLGEVTAILISAVVLGATLRRARGVAAALVAAALVLAYLGLSQWLFLATGIPLGLLYPLLAIALVYVTIGVHHFVTVDLEKRRTREAFSRYLSPHLANIVSENPDMLKLGGTRQCLTVLFSDIRGFTSISEGLEPETLVEILNVYLGEMTGIVFEHDGTLDKYIGDAIMAVWGAPVACADHAARACDAALRMRERLLERCGEWQAQGWPRIDAGIGLHTGDMVSGNMGSSAHLSYTVIGDNVNLGSRLEGLTKTYGVSLLVSEATRAAAGDAFVARELDVVAVKGKALPVRIYELLGRAADASRWNDLIARFDAALALFRARRFPEAESAFATVLEKYPEDGPSRLYISRCRIFAASPPPENWGGVTVMETK
ncbi:MAG TPA: adenylate/guanylate cyclase domain-containing protein [Candidatus Limnocylindrales bacterium]|nr:adenylate/guanylate cyclase domain-containing protein [Candidatus Limnocylindrales bacterium]